MFLDIGLTPARASSRKGLDSALGEQTQREANERSASARLPSLTSMRVIAALAVAVFHTRDAWAHWPLINWIVEYGWLGVSYFFLLSGFVLMWGFDPQKPKSDFVLRRLIRIYPLHLVCLVASLVLCIVFHRPIGGYFGTFWGTVANFFLVHDWIAGHSEIRQAWNGVSWTLSCELFFYIMAPFLFPYMLKTSSPVRLMGLLTIIWALLLGAGLLAWRGGWAQVIDVLVFFPVPRFFEFALGASAALIVRRGWRLRSPLACLPLLALPPVCFSYLVREFGTQGAGPFLIQLFIPGALLLIMSTAARDLAGRRSFTQNPLFVLLGEASFALYMTHAMLLGVAAPLVINFLPATRTSALWGGVATLIYLALAVLLSLAVHLWFEHPARVFFLRRLTFARRLETQGQGTPSPRRSSAKPSWILERLRDSFRTGDWLTSERLRVYRLMLLAFSFVLLVANLPLDAEK